MQNASHPPQARSEPLGIDEYARTQLRLRLRPYQLEAAQAVLDSIRARAGRTIVVLFSRQSGKDELSAVLKSYLLSRMHLYERSIVEVNPTYKPQTVTAMRRLDRRLRDGPSTRRAWRKGAGFIRSLGRAEVTFLSGEPEANVVSAVASLLLIVNEAQDVAPAVYDHKFAPMTASTNATRLFLGTAWTSHTLLARELRAARLEQQKDGIRRVFVYDAEQVRRVVPAYGAHVDAQIARLGRGHPLIRTQYFNEEIDAQAGMFTPARRAMMSCDSSLSPSASLSGQDPREPTALHVQVPHEQGDGRPSHPPVHGFTPLPRAGGGGAGGGGHNPPHPDWSRSDAHRSRTDAYVFSLDVAGQDEAAFHNPEEQMLRNPGRDAVTLTIAAVDLSALDTLQAPIFRILERRQWKGLNHLDVFARLAALADQWHPQHIVVDATGVGEGLWAMLDKRYPTRVLPVKFSAQKKSEIGYRYLAMIETGRVRDCAKVGIMPTEGIPAPRGAGTVTRADVDRQYAACISEVLPAPLRTMRWGVPEGTRDENGELIHDDIVLADALLAEADALPWTRHSPTLIIRPKDPLEEMSHFGSPIDG